jgi:hypothetical protein
MGIKSHGGMFGRTPVFDRVDVETVVVEKTIGGEGFDVQALAKVSESIADHEMSDDPHPQYLLRSEYTEPQSFDGGTF